MRDYAKISPRYWTGPTGKRIRALGLEAQVVALYLLTCPSANMIGLYYLPLPTLSHETGIPFEGACKALRSLSEARFSHYDEGDEVVWVPEMARYQIEDELKDTDNRCKGIWKEAEPFQKSKFFMDFWTRYEKAFHLPTPSHLEAPSEPLRSQEQEQEQEQEQAVPQEGSPAAPTEPSVKRLKVDTLQPQREEILAHWRAEAVPAGLPDVLKGTVLALQSKMNARLKDAAWLGLFREAVTYAARHPDGAWMRGEGPRKWKVNLEWLLKPGKAEDIAAKGRAAPGRVAPLHPRTSPAPAFQKLLRVGDA